MVLCQVIISDPAVTNYNLNLFGRKQFKLIKVDYRYTAGGIDKLIVIQSGHLRVPFSNYPYFIFSVNGNHQINNIHGNIIFNDVALDGSLGLRVLDFETGLAPTNFTYLVLLFEVTDFDS